MQERREAYPRKDRPSGRRPGPRGPALSLDERLSRLLAFVLRHHPEEAGLDMDERGSVDLDQMTEAVRARPGLQDVTREQIERLVAGPQSSRFAVSGGRIRARYGHSFAQPVVYEPAEPPPQLFHGTTPEAVEAMLAEGLKPGQRQHVHLSVDTPTAREVGRRRSSHPAILAIDTACAAKAGVRFYEASPIVWLSDPIPPECITRYE